MYIHDIDDILTDNTDADFFFVSNCLKLDLFTYVLPNTWSFTLGISHYKINIFISCIVYQR